MKTILLTLTTAFSLCLFMTATAAPVVAPGGFNPNQVQIQKSGGNVIINQKSQVTHIKWDTFNIGKGETTTFNQPNRSSVAVNRINSANGVSKIYGSLKANGRIILINQSGIYFAPGSFVNVGSIIASTSDMTKFDEKKYVFDIPSKIPNAAIVNQGTINAADYGLVALIGNRVENSGSITAHAGTVIMGAGNKFTLDFVGDQLLNFSIDEAASNGSTAQDVQDVGTVHVSAAATQKILDNSINTKSIPEATHFAQAANGDLIFSSGKIDVSGARAGQKGGKVKLLAKNVKVENAIIDASGNAGGGEVLIGGNYQGKGPEFNATTTSVDQATTINASATQKGNGGKVILWADGNTNFDSTILAKGGELSGDGGFVETSGKQTLNVGPNAIVNTLAKSGKTGTWLLDPTTITILNGLVSNNVAVAGPPYTINPTVSDPQTGEIGSLNLQTYLNSSNVNIFADTIKFGDGVTFTPITITWNAATSLAVNATTGIEINTDVSISGNSITAGMIFNGPVYRGTNAGPSAPSLTISFPIGAISFSSSIGKNPGSLFDPALGSLSVQGSLTLGSNDISIANNTITGIGSTSNNILNLSTNGLSANGPHPKTVFLTSSNSGYFDAYKDYQASYANLTFNNFTGIIGGLAGSTLSLPSTPSVSAGNAVLILPAPYAAAIINTNVSSAPAIPPSVFMLFPYDNFSTIVSGFYTRADVGDPGATLSIGPPIYTSPDSFYQIWTANGTDVTFLCPNGCAASTTPSGTSPTTAALATQTQMSAQSQASAATEEDSTSSTGTSVTTTTANVNSMLNTATQAIDTAFSDTKISPEKPGGGCGGSVATGGV